MKLYRVHMRGSPGTEENAASLGYVYFSNKREALKAFHTEPRDKVYDDIDFQEITIEISKTGIIRALNIYGGHPDNG